MCCSMLIQSCLCLQNGIEFKGGTWSSEHTQDESSLVCTREANLLWGDDLIRLLGLEHAVLQARLIRLAFASWCS